MDKFEEVKRILDNNTEIVTEYIGGDNTPFVVSYFDAKTAAIQICQLEQARVERILEIITKDFVEVVANLYMPCQDRQELLEFWQGVKRQALKKREMKDVASLDRIIKLPVCRVCGHRHCSWFEDSEGVICDSCLNEIACSGKDD